MVMRTSPRSKCLDILSKQTETAHFRTHLRRDHECRVGLDPRGVARAAAEVFDSLFCNMVDAGEAGGILDDILIRLAGYLGRPRP